MFHSQVSYLDSVPNNSLLVHSLLFPGALLLLLGGFSVTRTRYFGKIFPALGLLAGRRCCAVIRELIRCRSLGNPALPGSQSLCATAPGSKGGREAIWLFLVELSCQLMGPGLPGLPRLVVRRCTSMPGGWNSQGGGDAAPGKGITTLGVGLAPWRTLQASSPPGSRCRLMLFPGSKPGRRQRTWTNKSRGPSDKRKRSPGQEKAALWPKKQKKVRDRQCKGRSSWHCLCFRAHAEETLFWSKALCFPSWTQELQGGSGGAKIPVLVIQPETEEMWEGKVGAS